MNTTNAVTVYKIDDEDFGKLIDLPKIYNEAITSALNARSVTDKLMTPWEAIPDLKTADARAVEAILSHVRTLRVKLAATKQKLELVRKPHTDKMRAIVSAIVAQENAVEADFQRTKKAEDDWQLEILRRNNEAKRLADTKFAEAQATIKRKAEIAKVINATFGKDLTDRIVSMHKKFYDFTDVVLLTNWISTMKKWVPVYDGKEVQREAVGALNEILAVRASLIEGFKTEYADRCAAERNTLIDLLPGRIIQLQSGSPVEQVVDVDNFASSVLHAVRAMNEVVSDDATKESINASFDAAPELVLESGGGVGKRVKKKYKCDSAEALQTIMQSWVTFNMKLLSIEELNKKLSFMRTAADVRLNEGAPILEAKGLSVVDDISTRTKSTKND